MLLFVYFLLLYVILVMGLDITYERDNDEQILLFKYNNLQLKDIFGSPKNPIETNIPKKLRTMHKRSLSKFENTYKGRYTYKGNCIHGTKLTGGAESVNAEIADVGETIMLSCHFCGESYMSTEKSKLWYKFEQIKTNHMYGNLIDTSKIYWKASEINLGTEYHDNRIYTILNHNLIITNISLEDRGAYFCAPYEHHELHMNAIFSSRHMTTQSAVSMALDWKQENQDMHKVNFFHFLDVMEIPNEMEYVMQSSEEFDKPEPPMINEEHNWKVYTDWNEWTRCSECDVESIRFRLGHCKVKKIKQEYKVQPAYYQHIFDLYKDGVSCHSTIFQEDFTISYRRQEIEIANCHVQCSVFNKKKTGKDIDDPSEFRKQYMRESQYFININKLFNKDKKKHDKKNRNKRDYEENIRLYRARLKSKIKEDNLDIPEISMVDKLIDVSYKTEGNIFSDDDDDDNETSRPNIFRRVINRGKDKIKSIKDQINQTIIDEQRNIENDAQPEYTYMQTGGKIIIPCPGKLDDDKVRWRKDGVRLILYFHKNIKVNKLGVLTIRDAKIKDAGMYTCYYGIGKRSSIIRHKEIVEIELRMGGGGFWKGMKIYMLISATWWVLFTLSYIFQQSNIRAQTATILDKHENFMDGWVANESKQQAKDRYESFLSKSVKLNYDDQNEKIDYVKIAKEKTLKRMADVEVKNKTKKDDIEVFSDDEDELDAIQEAKEEKEEKEREEKEEEDEDGEEGDGEDGEGGEEEEEEK